MTSAPLTPPSTPASPPPSARAASARIEAGPAGEASNGRGVGARWRVPLLWRVVLVVGRILVPLVCRLRVTGDVPEGRREGPLILAGNHISVFDPIAFVAAAHILRIAPRMMATGGVFRAPVVGRLMYAAGHIPVDRGRESVRNAVPDAVAALRAGSVVFIYPEGRIGLDPGMWPERAKHGLARLALETGATVVPVATWGAHRVMAYHGRGAMTRTLFASFLRRPFVRVHLGEPVNLSDLRAGERGHAQRASERILDAITADLARLRADEPGLPRFLDPTRPLSTARKRRR